MIKDFFMENKRKKEINKCLIAIKLEKDMQSVCRLHELTGHTWHYIAFKYLGNNIDADDVVQDFWANIFVVADKYRHNTNAFAYLSKTFTNMVINYCIKKGRDVNRVSNYIDCENMASDNGSCIEDTLINSVIASAINLLSEQEKEVIHMMFFEDKTIREIAKILNKSKSQIGRIKQSALQSLKTYLKENLQEDNLSFEENIRIGE